MYKVIEVFSLNDEKWAKLLKSEKQLRKKTYDAKMSELFLVPGQAAEEQSKESDNDESEAEETPTTKEKGSENRIEEFYGQEEKTSYSDLKNNPGNNTEAILPQTNTRNLRKSAKKGRDFIKDLTVQGLLIIQNKPEKVLKHGWNWDTFNEMIDNEPLNLTSEPRPQNFDNPNENSIPTEVPFVFDINIDQALHPVNNGKKKVNDNQNEFDEAEEKSEEELVWDHSPEQLDATFLTAYVEEESNDEALERILQPLTLFPTKKNTDHRERLPAVSVNINTEVTVESLTSEDTDDEIFPKQFNDREAPRNIKLKRKGAIRRPYTQPSSESVKTSVIQCPRNTCELPVDVHHEVIADAEDDKAANDEVHGLRRSSRLRKPIDYGLFNETGAKESDDRGGEKEEKKVAE